MNVAAPVHDPVHDEDHRAAVGATEATGTPRYRFCGAAPGFVVVDPGVQPLPETFLSAERLVAGGWSADLIAGNNALAQVSDLHGFVAGLRQLFKPSGVASPEFPPPAPPDRRDPVQHDLP